MKNVRIIAFAAIVLAVIAAGCSDMLDLEPPGIANESTLENRKGIEQLLIGAYKGMIGTGRTPNSGRSAAHNNWVWGGVASDDAYKGSLPGDSGYLTDIEAFYVQADNTAVADHWDGLYGGLSRANTTLRILARATDMTEDEKTEVEAELRFIRGHFYVELARVHGNVPYIDENTENPGLVSNNQPVWPMVKADFEFAMNNLPRVKRQGDLGRATAWAAQVYLAYVHMYLNEHAEAMPLLQDIYDNGPFSLMPNYQENHLIAFNNNNESIFEFQYAVNDGAQLGIFDASPNAGEALLGQTFMGGSGYYQPTHNLVSAYRVNATGLPEFLGQPFSMDQAIPYDPTGTVVTYTGPVDPRLDHAIGRPGVPFLDWGIQKGHSWVRDATNGGPYIGKKEMFLLAERGSRSALTGRSFSSENNYRKFKLNQVILWLAECEIEIGSLQRATELVNEIRARADQSEVVRFANGTPAANYLIGFYPTFATREYAREAVRHEIRLETAMEGYRFYDLQRWGIAARVMNNHLTESGKVMPYLRNRIFTEGKNEIWPIPQIQLDITVDGNGQRILTQNPGY
jgi:hypothetical protein